MGNNKLSKDIDSAQENSRRNLGKATTRRANQLAQARKAKVRFNHFSQGKVLLLDSIKSNNSKSFTLNQ